MESFLKELLNITLYDIILINNKGDILIHHDSSKNWGFYKENKFNISEQYPNDYKEILLQNIYKTDTFVSKKFDVPIYDGLNLILLLKESYLNEQKKEQMTQYAMVSTITFVLSLLLSILVVRKFSKVLLKLEEKTNELESIFNTSIAGIAVLDLDTRYLYFNKAYCDMLGYSEEELKTKKCTDLTAPQYLEESKKIYEKVLKEGSYENFERECVSKRNGVKVLNSSIALMPNKKHYLLSTTDHTELRNAYNFIKEQTYIDELTKVHNRKAYNERLDELFSQYKRYRDTFSILMFDIDLFKSINDTYGHIIGDEVLIELSNLVKKSIRKNDYFFRIGGEEFIILLTKTKIDDAVIYSEKIRNEIENELKIIKNRIITVSIGVTEVREDDSENSIYKRVDDNLYYAKEHGRNKVVSHIK